METRILWPGLRALSAVSLLALVAACGGGGSGSNDEALRRQLAALDQPPGLEVGATADMVDAEDGPEFQDTTEFPDVKTLDATGAPITYKTHLQNYTVSAAFDTQVLLNPGSDVIYPGSVLLGHTIDDGSYVEVTRGTKKAVTLSYDLTGVKGGVVSGQIVPTLDAFRELHNKIMSQTIPAQSTIYSYEATQIRSQQELDLKINAGAKYSAPTIEISVKAGFHFTAGSRQNKFMIRFMQTFYTVDLSQGGNPFLFDALDVADFHGYRPVYVASVAYGRLAYLTLETDETWESIKASLDVCVNATSYEGNLEYDMALQELREKATVNITVVGGSTVATSIEGFDEFLRTGGFSSTNSGKVVAYKLRFVDDNTIANTVFAGSYTVRRTEAVAGRGIRIGMQAYAMYNATDYDGDTAEFAGRVLFRDQNSSAVVALWDYPEGASCDVPADGTFYWDWGYHYIDFPNPTAGLVLEIANFIEVDGGDNDEYSGSPVSRTVGDVIGGPGTLTIETRYDDDEYVVFYLNTSYEYLY